MEDYLQNFTLPHKQMSSLRLFHIGFPQGGRGSVLPIHRSTVRHLELLTQGCSAQPPVPASSLLTLLELCPGSWINPAEGSNKHPQSLQRLNDQGGAPGSTVFHPVSQGDFCAVELLTHHQEVSTHQKPRGK